jgi:hypothetical protein
MPSFSKSEGDAHMALAQLLPAIQELPAPDKLKLIRVLAEELDSGEDISPLVPHKVYYLPTLYDAVGTGRMLLDAIYDQQAVGSAKR